MFTKIKATMTIARTEKQAVKWSQTIAYIK